MRYRRCENTDGGVLQGTIQSLKKDVGAWDTLERFVVEDCEALEHGKGDAPLFRLFLKVATRDFVRALWFLPKYDSTTVYLLKVSSKFTLAILFVVLNLLGVIDLSVTCVSGPLRSMTAIQKNIMLVIDLRHACHCGREITSEALYFFLSSFLKSASRRMQVSLWRFVILVFLPQRSTVVSRVRFHLRPEYFQLNVLHRNLSLSRNLACSVSDLELVLISAHLELRLRRASNLKMRMASDTTSFYSEASQ